MNLDWHRLKAVVLESDDWGLCAWVPDDRAHRALALLPAFRTPAGLRYGRSTLETAEDVAALAEVLREVRGGDGFPAVWQANTIVANPDFGRLVPPLFPADTLPPVEAPESAAAEVMSTYLPSGENAAPCTEDDAGDPSGSTPRRETSPVAATAARGTRARAPAAAITAARGMR